MTHATHTPGPWLIADLMIEALADPENSDSYYAPICELDEGWNDETNRANARLIAAAPELLAALEGIDEELSLWGEDTLERMNLTARLEAIRAAIAKAKGE